jgi:hypothetical protein
MSRLIQFYYLATPAFYAIDSLWGVNVRVAFLDHWPAGKTAYYLIAFVLGIIAWRRPAWAAQIGLVESSTNLGLLILSVLVWYGGVLEAAGADFGMPAAVAPGALANFVLTAAMGATSYIFQRARVVGAGASNT